MKDNYNPIIRELREQGLTWKQIADKINEAYGSYLSADACRKRDANYNPDFQISPKISNEEEIITYGDGSKERSLKSESSLQSLTNEEKLVHLGENPNEMELVWYQEKKWDAQTPDGIQTLYSIGYRVKPSKKVVEPTDYIKEAQEVFKQSIKPLKLPTKKENKTLDEDKLLEMPGIELHIGKLGWNGDVGEDFDQHIAKNRFRHIILETLKEQQIQKCGTVVVYIGNDFFNSEANGMTTNGTPQHNDVRWKKMFNVGLELYIEALTTIRQHFNKVEVRLVSGNHDRYTSFYLYMALSQRFSEDKIINFSNNYQDTQCFIWGKCGIFTNHGDPNLKRLIKSIPAEFYKEWGSTIFRELHLGHLHKEVVVDDDSGMITRRVGSPAGTDNWHYENRFIGATQKYQLFIWHKERGLENIKYINFEKEKVMTR